MKRGMKRAVCENCGKPASRLVPEDATHVTCFHCSEIPDRTKTVMRVVGMPSSSDGRSPVDGQYLREFSAEAHDGRGSAIFTDDIARAMRFDGPAKALEFYRTVPENRPIRDDGRPNRPLTTFSMEVLSVGRAMRQDREDQTVH